MIFLKENRILTFQLRKFPQILLFREGNEVNYYCYTGILFHNCRTSGAETIPSVSHCFLTAISVLLNDSKFKPPQFLPAVPGTLLSQCTHLFLSPNHVDLPSFRALQTPQSGLTTLQALPWAWLNFLNCSKEKYATVGKTLISN